MTSMFARRATALAAFCLLLCGLGVRAEAQNAPRIAVTDLAYEEKVAEYFSIYAEKETGRASKGRSGGGHASAQGQREVFAATGEVIRIDRGELRKFSGDIKGELLKSRFYRVVQGKPWTQTNTEKLFDIIERIKSGYYSGADYVLFGTVDSVDFRNEAFPIQGSNATSVQLSLEVAAEFSLINTKTYEVKAAFSAIGEGNDTRLVNMPGSVVSLSRAKVMAEVSKSLGIDVMRQIEEQFGPAGSSPPPYSGRDAASTALPAAAPDKVTVYH